MESLTVEQKIQGSTYKPAEQAAKATAILSGFAFSFEDLLQRVGARVNQAFSAADSSSGILTSSPDARADAAPRDNERRAANPESRERPSDSGNTQVDARTPVANDSRDTDQGRNTQSNDTGAAERTSRSSDGDSHGGQQANNSDRESASSDAAGDNGQNGQDAAANNGDANNGNSDGNNTGEQAATSTGTDNAAQNAAAAGQAAALYAAGAGRHRPGRRWCRCQGAAGEPRQQPPRDGQQTDRPATSRRRKIW